MFTIPGRIPISIHPFFWLLAGLIGWLNSGSLVGTLIWILIILVSVIVHEYGHAITALLFGKKPKIDLVALGGLTSYEPTGLSYLKQFLIVLNGPLFGIGLALIATFVLYLNLFTSPLLVGVTRIFQLVNFFWSFVNLIPILPLDGGQLLRIALEGFFGAKGFRLSLFIGMVIGGSFALLSFLFGYFLLGALFFLFAFQGFDMWRRSRGVTDVDRKDENKIKLLNGEKALLEGHKDEAKRLFEEIKNSSTTGLIHDAAVQYLGLIYLEENRQKEAYDLLVQVRDKLTGQALSALHELAFDQGDFQTVIEIGSDCYQETPHPMVALRNAKAFAAMKNARHAAGWLSTACKTGEMNKEEILQDKVFDQVKDDPEFKNF